MNSTLQRLHGWRKESVESDSFQDCTLVVPTYRRLNEIIELLTHLTTLPDIPCEVVIVDGSPEHEVNSAISAWAKNRDLRFGLTYIKSPAGLTRQRNVGLDACDREFVFFLDDDSLPEPGYFRESRQVFLNDVSEEIGAIRPVFKNELNRPTSRMRRLRFALGLQEGGVPGKYYHSGTSGAWDMTSRFSGTRNIDVLAGAAAAYRRKVFSEKRFSAFFHGYSYGEDTEMSLRIRNNWKIVVCGDALVHHKLAEGGRPVGFPGGRMAMRNRYFIWKRYSPEAGIKDRVKFWGDHFFSATYFLLGFLTKPARNYFVGYAMGTFAGALECVVSPPRHEEPPARKEYEFCFNEFPREVAATQTTS